ncbi:hypothetical protein F4778DRAFT_679493 [Xylariomycetidae sp. FL2044]|nr:hypothetical protein F4778DRAFT_679493 [Xylariomycetidae sp. FL2044]
MTYPGRRGRPFPRDLTWRQQPMAPQYPQQPFGSIVRSLALDDLRMEAVAFEKKAVIKDCSPVASYSWLNAPEPTLLVPGKPPRWSPLKDPVPLPQDSGKYYRDKNAARFPKHPMEPSIVSLLATQPQARLDKAIDIVACSSTLGNLLRLTRGQDKLFRILVEVVDGTVFLIRRENSPTELIEGIYGFGHTFPENYTTWDEDVRGSDNHQRILRYSFGDLNLLLRFGADGYMIDEAKMSTKAQTSAKTTSMPSSISDLEASLIGAQISTVSSAPQAEVSLKSGGKMVDQSLVFDIKTRSIKKKDQDVLGEEIPRLWVAQIPTFILAYHRNGLFKNEDILVRDVRDDVKTWERDNVQTLSKFAALLHQIVDIAHHAASKKIEICHTRAGTLDIREQLPGCGDALSSSVVAQWQASKEPDVEESDSGEDGGIQWNEDDVDFTACSDACAYCGRCAS